VRSRSSPRPTSFAWLALAVGVACAGCGGAPPLATGDGVLLDVSLASVRTRAPDVAAATASLYVASVEAISDRGAGEARARASALSVDAGSEPVRAKIPAAPPGLYSAVALSLGDDARTGLHLTGTRGSEPLEIDLRLDAVVVRCAPPARLAAGGTLHLTLTADPVGWLDGVDLSKAVTDGDERGILINHEDNAGLGEQILANVARSFSLGCE